MAKVAESVSRPAASASVDDEMLQDLAERLARLESAEYRQTPAYRSSRRVYVESVAWLGLGVLLTIITLAFWLGGA